MINLSIVVPVYNVEKYLKDCLNSLVDLDIENYEIVLINDGSTDGSMIIINDYLERYPNLIRCHCQQNAGLSMARNKGIDIALGDYIVFIDSDDYILGDEFTRFWNDVKASDCDISEANFEKDIEGDIQKRNFISKKEEFVNSPSMDGIDYVNKTYDYVSNNLDVEVVTRIYKKSFLNDNSLRFKPGILHEDTLFTFTAYLKAKTVRIYPYVFYRYRMRAGSIMHSINKKHYDSVLIIAKEIKKLKNENKLELKAIDSTIIELVYEASKYDGIVYKEDLNEIITGLKKLTLKARIKKCILKCKRLKNKVE